MWSKFKEKNARILELFKVPEKFWHLEKIWDLEKFHEKSPHRNIQVLRNSAVC